MKKTVFALIACSLLFACASTGTPPASTGGMAVQGKAATPAPILLPKTLSGHTDFVRAVAFSPDGRTAVSGSTDKSIILWDLATGEKLRAFIGHTGFIQSLAFSADGKALLSGSADSTVKLWDVPSGKEIRTFAEGSADTWVYSAAFTPDGKSILSGTSRGLLKLWDIATGAELRVFKGHAGKYYGVHAVAVSPDGKTAASGSEDQTVRLWDLKTGATIRTLAGFGGTVNALAFSRDGQRLLAGASGSGESSPDVFLFHLASGKRLLALVSGGSETRAVAFLPDGKTAFSGGWRLVLWDLENGAKVRSFPGHDGAVNALALSPDGGFLLSASDDETLRLWDAREKPAMAQMETPYGEFNSLIAKKDTDRIYTAAKWLLKEKKDKPRFRQGLDSMLKIAREDPDPVVRADAIGEIASDMSSSIPGYLESGEIQAIYATVQLLLESDVSAEVRRSALDIVYDLAKAGGDEAYIRGILGVFKRDTDIETLDLAARQVSWMKDVQIALPADTRETIEAAARRLLTVQKTNAAWAAFTRSGYSFFDFKTLVPALLENAMPDDPFVCSNALGRIDNCLTYSTYAEDLRKDPGMKVDLLLLRYIVFKNALNPRSTVDGTSKSMLYTLELQSVDSQAQSQLSIEDQARATIANFENQNMKVLQEGAVNAGLLESYKKDILKMWSEAGGYSALLKPLADMTDPATQPDPSLRLLAWKALGRSYQDEDGMIVDKLPEGIAASLAQSLKKETYPSVLPVARVVVAEGPK
jgi:hypothetical protein